jgi:hypothetical protein
VLRAAEFLATSCSGLFAAAALYLSLLALVLMAWTLAFRYSRRCA